MPFASLFQFVSRGAHPVGESFSEITGRRVYGESPGVPVGADYLPRSHVLRRAADLGSVRQVLHRAGSGSFLTSVNVARQGRGNGRTVSDQTTLPVDPDSTP